MTTLCASILAALALFAPADDPKPKADDAKGDLAKMQGEWNGTLQIGQEIPLTIKVEKDQMIVTFVTPDGDEAVLEGTIKLDESADPKQIDMVDWTAPDGSSLPDNKGIYKFDGETLVLCTGGHDNPRPKEFKTSEGPGAALLTLKKGKKVD